MANEDNTPSDKVGGGRRSRRKGKATKRKAKASKRKGKATKRRAKRLSARAKRLSARLKQVSARLKPPDVKRVSVEQDLLAEIDPDVDVNNHHNFLS